MGGGSSPPTADESLEICTADESSEIFYSYSRKHATQKKNFWHSQTRIAISHPDVRIIIISGSHRFSAPQHHDEHVDLII